MTRPIATLAALFIVLLPAGVAAADGGVEALDRGDYVEAARLLEEESIAAPSAATYYNLGLAYLRAGERGMAAWAALSSRALGGVDATEALLAEVERAAPPELRPLRPPRLALVWRRLATVGPDDSWAAGALALSLFGGIAGAIAAARRGSGRPRRSWFALAAFAFLGSGACAALALTRADLRSSTSAAVVAETALHAAPSAQSEAIRPLPAGVTLRLGESLAGYYAVTLPTGEAGWVPAAGVRAVLR